MAKENALVGLCIFFIWVTLAYVELSIIGATYPYVLLDNETGNFGVGLNWLTLDPLTYRQHPAPTTNLLYGLVVWLVEIDSTEKSLEKFITIGIVIQALVVALCSYWYSWITSALKLDITTRLFLVILIFSIPALLIRVGHPGFFFELGILGLPLGLTLYATLLGNEKAAIIGGIGCGIATANFFLFWVPIILFVAIYMDRWPSKKYPVRYIFNINSVNKKEITLIILFTVLLLAMYCGIVVSDLPHDKFRLMSNGLVGLIIAVLWICGCLLGLILLRWDNRIGGFVFGLTIAFLVSNSILLPWYAVGLMSATELTHGDPFTLSPLGAPLSLKPLLLFTEYPWYFVFWITLVLIMGSAVYRYRRVGVNHETVKTDIYASIFSCITLLIIAITNSPFIKSGDVPGMGDRSMIVVIPSIGIGWLLILNVIQGKKKIVFQMVLVMLLLGVMIDFYTKYSSEIKNNRTEGMLLDQELTKFLSENNTGRIICVGEEFSSKYCATAFSYNRYRTRESIRNNDTTDLFNKRVVSLRYRDWEMLDDVEVRAAMDSKIILDQLPSLVVTLEGGYQKHLITLMTEAGLIVTPLWKYLSVREAKRLDEFLTIEGNTSKYQTIPTFEKFVKGRVSSGSYIENASNNDKTRWYSNFKKGLERARASEDKSLFKSILRNHGLLLGDVLIPNIQPGGAFIVSER